MVFKGWKNPNTTVLNHYMESCLLRLSKIWGDKEIKNILFVHWGNTSPFWMHRIACSVPKTCIRKLSLQLISEGNKEVTIVICLAFNELSSYDYSTVSHTYDPIVTLAARILTLEFLKATAILWSSCCRTRELYILAPQKLNSSLCVQYCCLICTSCIGESTWSSVSDLPVYLQVHTGNSSANPGASYCCTNMMM